jgi:hypothetical protein
VGNDRRCVTGGARLTLPSWTRVLKVFLFWGVYDTMYIFNDTDMLKEYFEKFGEIIEVVRGMSSYSGCGLCAVYSTIYPCFCACVGGYER